MPHSASRRISPSRPAVVAFMTMVFAMPFTSGSLWFVAYTYLALLLFIGHVALASRRLGFSLAGQLKTRQPLLFWLLCAFSVSSLLSWLSVVLADNRPGHKLLATLQYSGYLLIAAYTFMLARFLLLQRLSLLQLFLLMAGGTVVLMLLLLGFYHLADAPNAQLWGLDPPVGIHARIMGMLASVSVLACTVALLFGRQSLARCLLPLAGVFLCCGFLVWTGSRMSMLVTLLTLLLLAGLAAWQGRLNWRRLLPVLLVMALSVPVAERFAVLGWTGLQRAVSVSALPAADQAAPLFETANTLSSGRMAIWRASLQGVSRAPWFGLGPHGYLFMPERPDRYYQSHNMLLQFLLEWGLVGAGLLLAVLLLLAWQGLKKLPQAVREGDQDYLVAAAVVFSLTLNGMTDGTYFMMVPLFMLATAFAVFPLLDRPLRERLAAG